MNVTELFAIPRRWTKRSMGATLEGKPVLWSHPKAVCFCLLGALRKLNLYNDVVLIEVAEAIRTHFPRRAYSMTGDEDITITRFNDHIDTTIADVLAVVKAAGI